MARWHPSHTFRPGLASSPIHPLSSPPTIGWLLLIMIEQQPSKAEAPPSLYYLMPLPTQPLHYCRRPCTADNAAMLPTIAAPLPRCCHCSAAAATALPLLTPPCCRRAASTALTMPQRLSPLPHHCRAASIALPPLPPPPCCPAAAMCFWSRTRGFSWKMGVDYFMICLRCGTVQSIVGAVQSTNDAHIMK